jgi:hypothetical protein
VPGVPLPSPGAAVQRAPLPASAAVQGAPLSSASPGAAVQAGPVQPSNSDIYKAIQSLQANLLAGLNQLMGDGLVQTLGSTWSNVMSNQMMIQAIDANVKIAAEYLASIMGDGFELLWANLCNTNIDPNRYNIPDSIFH